MSDETTQAALAHTPAASGAAPHAQLPGGTEVYEAHDRLLDGPEIAADAGAPP
ncbi:MAG TPA: hypothetical protein VM261_23695 [Kofleriaceae bacterium]|nr:hypothetical protein [Kofleriaceae bacterium]